MSSICAVALLIGGALVVGGCGGNVPAPTSFTSYNAKDNTFRCDYPADWEASGGGTRYQWAKFTAGSAEIRVNANLVGSLMGDIAESGGPAFGIVETDESLEPVAQVHEMEQEQIANEMSNYEEQEPEVVNVKLGPARKSEFTASGSFGGKLHGYRVTVLGRDKRVRVICTCPESNWTTLQPAFDHVIDSFTRGGS